MYEGGVALFWGCVHYAEGAAKGVAPLSHRLRQLYSSSVLIGVVMWSSMPDSRLFSLSASIAWAVMAIMGSLAKRFCTNWRFLSREVRQRFFPGCAALFLEKYFYLSMTGQKRPLGIMQGNKGGEGVKKGCQRTCLYESPPLVFRCIHMFSALEEQE